MLAEVFGLFPEVLSCALLFLGELDDVLLTALAHK